MNVNRMPDFIIIGAAKSGTTSLYDYLIQHPDIFMSNPKEPCFFDDTVAWDKGLEWYASLFNEAKENQLCGEASTNYTRWPQVSGVPEKIKMSIPGVKLIYVIRNPVERAYSHYVHRWTKEVNPGKPFTMDFFEYARKDPVCIDSSRYAEQLDRYLEVFEKEQILVIVFEDLLQNPGVVLARVHEFLDLKKTDTLNNELPFANENKLFRYHIVRKQLTSKIKKLWGVDGVLKLIPSTVKDKLYNKVMLKTAYAEELTAGFCPPPLTDNEKNVLKDIFSDENNKLAELWKIDISYWS